MLNTIVFDLDGTLLDTLADLANSVNYALRTHQLKERTLSEVRQFLGNGIRYLMEHAVDGAVTGEAFEKVFCSTGNICLDPGFLNLLTYLINQFLHISFSDILAQGYLLYQIIIGFRFKIFQ